MTIALWIILGIVGYLNIGYRWGRLSWIAWGKSKRSFTGLLCFPVSYKKNQIDKYQNDGKSIHPFIVSYYKQKDEYGYAKGVAILWPLKALLNFCTLFWFGLEYFFNTLFDVIIRIASKVIDITLSPSRISLKKSEDLPEAKTVNKKR